MTVLIFDIWGAYAHYKKIYATTSALSYAIPPKTSLYGYVAAIVGLEKKANRYLAYFEPGLCQIAIEIRAPLRMQRINTNLRPHLGRLKETDNRKPTTMEYVYQPSYRIYVAHQDTEVYDALKKHLLNHTAVYTPSLGLANLISSFQYVDEVEILPQKHDEALPIHSVIPKQYFIELDMSPERINQIEEATMYAVEMNTEREVTQRDSILYERQGNEQFPIWAQVTQYYSVHGKNIVLF